MPKLSPILVSRVHIEPPGNQDPALEFLNRAHLGRDLKADDDIDQNSPLVKATFRMGRHEQTILLARVDSEGSRIPVAISINGVIYDLANCPTLEKSAWQKLKKSK